MTSSEDGHVHDLSESPDSLLFRIFPFWSRIYFPYSLTTKRISITLEAYDNGLIRIRFAQT